VNIVSHEEVGNGFHRSPASSWYGRANHKPIDVRLVDPATAVTTSNISFSAIRIK
jgi:hypothetical protein